PGRGADQGGLDREGVRERAERASRLGRHGDPRARRPARARRAGGAARRPPPVALHHRADATLRGRHQRDPARHHRAARARPAAEVNRAARADGGAGGGPARGAPRVTLAVAEEGARAGPAAFATRVRRRGQTLRLEGEKRYVLQGVTADAFLVAARDGEGVSAVLVPAGAPGVSVRPQKTFGKDRQSAVRLKDVRLPRSALAGRPGRAWPGFAALRTRLAALLCADMIGGADAVLEMTTRYVCEREQFGVKLGTFQAVQQMVAVMAIELEGARHVTRQAL